MGSFCDTGSEQDEHLIFETATKWAEARIPFGEVVVPLLMRLNDRLTVKDRHACIQAVESWVVRRKLALCNTGGDKQLFGKLSKEIGEAPDDAVSGLLSELRKRGWPTDQQVRCELARRDMRRHKDLARMVLEAIELHLAGSESSVDPPTNMEIEHLMPIRWHNRRNDWPLPGGMDEEERHRAIWTLGNLTLVTPELNRKLGDHPWPEKCSKLEKNNGWNLFLNLHLLEHFRKLEQWNEDAIQTRGCQLAKFVCRIWKIPLSATAL